MVKIWFLIYNFIALPLLNIFFKLLGLVNKKVRRGLKQRKKLFENLIIDLTGLDKSKKMIWFHSASMGEFEQAKPIIQKLKEEKDLNIIVTFFSPSGYDNSRNYKFADVISYIPFDTKRGARKFLQLVRPDLAVMMRYDIWPNMIWQLDENNIPCIIADATMRIKTARKWPLIKSFHNTMYSRIERILTISEEDKESFKAFNIEEENIKAVGDTRFDRVYTKSKAASTKKLFKDGLFENKKVFVMGSTWEADEAVLFPALGKLLKNDKAVIAIVVPHEPTIHRLDSIENQLPKEFPSIRFSHMNDYKEERIIIVDSIGILLSLYYYSDAAYVGGSFKQGIHNVLEPAVYGVPVFYGPKIENSQEAQELVRLGSGVMVKNKKNLYRALRKIFGNENLRKELGEISSNYTNKNIGATQKILQEIYTFL